MGVFRKSQVGVDRGNLTSKSNNNNNHVRIIRTYTITILFTLLGQNKQDGGLRLVRIRKLSAFPIIVP